MIEIFETCQTKSIAKQTNRDESLIIRSIGKTYSCTVILYSMDTYNEPTLHISSKEDMSLL